MEDSLVSSISGQLKYEPRGPELHQIKADGALPAGPMAAVAALWGSDEPILGLGSSPGLLQEESLKDVQLSGAVASLWGAAEPSCGPGTSGQHMGCVQDAWHAAPQQLAAPAQPVLAPQEARAVPHFPVEPVFQQVPQRGAPAMHSPAAPVLPGPAVPTSGARAGQLTGQVVQSPWATAMPQPAGGGNPARGLLMRAAPPPRQQQPPSYGMSTAPMASMSNGQRPAPRVTFSEEQQHQLMHGAATTSSGFRQGQAFSRPGPMHDASTAAGRAPGHGDGAAEASAAAAASARSWPVVRDLGARKAHQVEGDDEDYGRMQLDPMLNSEHMVMPTPAEVEFHMKSMLPPPQARDLGAHRTHATQADDLQEMLMMQHLSMEDLERSGPGEAEAEPPPPAAPQQWTQAHVVGSVQPSWVLGAPEVARDMKRAAHYWKDPLTRADFSGAVDQRAMQMPPPAPPRVQPAQSPPGERVYYEERWDESVLIDTTAGPPGAVRSDLGPAIGAAALHQGHFAAQHAGMGMHSGRPDLQGEPRRFPPRAASGLAARLDNVISQLEGHGDAEAAVDDLRSIEASYNAALNAGRM